MIHRRGFIKQAGLASLAVSTLTFDSGCWFSNVYKNLVTYIAVALQAFQSVIDLLTGAGVISAGAGTIIDNAIALVKAGFADVQTLVKNYEDAPADQKQTLIGRISTAISVLEAQIQTFWNDLKIPDPKLAALISGLLGIILSTLGGFMTKLPAPTLTKQSAAASTLPNRIAFTPQLRTAKEFRRDWNNFLAEHGQPKVFF